MSCNHDSLTVPSKRRPDSRNSSAVGRHRKSQGGATEIQTLIEGVSGAGGGLAGQGQPARSIVSPPHLLRPDTSCNTAAQTAPGDGHMLMSS
jgi:hypothetical protein